MPHSSRPVHGVSCPVSPGIVFTAPGLKIAQSLP